MGNTKAPRSSNATSRNLSRVPERDPRGSRSGTGTTKPKNGNGSGTVKPKGGSGSVSGTGTGSGNGTRSGSQSGSGTVKPRAKSGTGTGTEKVAPSKKAAEKVQSLPDKTSDDESEAGNEFANGCGSGSEPEPERGVARRELVPVTETGRDYVSRFAYQVCESSSKCNSVF